jgi:phosphoenolpyruvate carboxylase
MYSWTTKFIFPSVKSLNPADFTNEITRSTIESFKQLKIQENNGELGANRYIISNNESALNVMETLQWRLSWLGSPTVDVIPLFWIGRWFVECT